MKANVFVKPNEQNRIRSSYAMARKGAMKWSSHSVFATPKIRASPMRSIIKPFPKARYSSAFSVEIFVKDFVREIIYELLKYFLRSNNLNKISSKDFLRSRNPKNHPYKFRLNSDDPMIQALQYNNITVSQNDFRVTALQLQFRKSKNRYI